jgi:hypothetical protein
MSYINSPAVNFIYVCVLGTKNFDQFGEQVSRIYLEFVMT